MALARYVLQSGAAEVLFLFRSCAVLCHSHATYVQLSCCLCVVRAPLRRRSRAVWAQRSLASGAGERQPNLDWQSAPASRVTPPCFWSCEPHLFHKPNSRRTMPIRCTVGANTSEVLTDVKTARAAPTLGRHEPSVGRSPAESVEAMPSLAEANQNLVETTSGPSGNEAKREDI